MRREKIRRVAAVLAFFLLWGGAECCARYFTEPVRQAWPMIREDRLSAEGSIDTAFVGASLFRNGIIPSVFDAAVGGRSFNGATSSQSMELSYYALEDLAETNPLRLALIDISVNRLLSDGDEGVAIAKHVLLSHMINPKARRMLLRDCFTLDELPLTILHSARDQLHFLWGTLRERLKPEYLSDYLKHGYAPDKTYPAGSMGYTPSFGANPDGGVPMAEFARIADGGGPDGDHAQLERILRLCRERGITPVLVSMPTTDAFLLCYKPYEALLAPVRELAAREGVLCLDFNLSRFRVSSLTAANFSDARHLNSSGAELFTPLISEVVRKALAGEDVSGYFYDSYDEMLRDIDRVAAVGCEVLDSGDGPTLVADSLHGPDVAPVYSFFIKASGADDYEPLPSEGNRCGLDGVAPGTYQVRVEASGSPGSGCEVYTEKVVTIR